MSAALYERGDEADFSTIYPGDFILVHGESWAPRLIRFGQRLRFRGARAPYAYWNHAALCVGGGWLIEAKGGRPVSYVELSQYKNRDYILVRTDGCDDMRENAVDFAVSQLGHGYNYLLIFSLALWSLFGGNVTLGFSSADICSGLVARSIERLGYIFEKAPEATMPADLAEEFNIT